MMNPTRDFVIELQQLMDSNFNEKDFKQVSRCFLDYMAATNAGVYLLNERIECMVDMFGSCGIISPIGFDTKVSLETAAFINGLTSHVAEMDDGVRFGMIHPGAPIFSALIPAAERFKVKGIDFVKGVIIGYEAAVRLSSAIQPSHYKNGFHPTATCGSIGATMGLSAMLGFNYQEMENALGAISTSAGGSLKVVDDGSELKPYNVARAASRAIQAAVIAKSGFTSPQNVLFGKTGFLEMTADNLNEDRLQNKAPNGLWINHVYVKPYSACRHAHPAIEAALFLHKNQSITIDEISLIEITTYSGLKGRHDRNEVSSIDSARMSIPFSVAIALVNGSAGINDFTKKNLENEYIRNLAKKITINECKEYSDRVPEQRPAKIKINLKNKPSLNHEIIYPKGEPENPMTDQELEDKFRELSGYGGISDKNIEGFISHIWFLKDRFDSLQKVVKNFSFRG